MAGPSRPAAPLQHVAEPPRAGTAPTASCQTGTQPPPRHAQKPLLVHPKRRAPCHATACTHARCEEVPFNANTPAAVQPLRHKFANLCAEGSLAGKQWSPRLLRAAVGSRKTPTSLDTFAQGCRFFSPLVCPMGVSKVFRLGPTVGTVPVPLVAEQTVLEHSLSNKADKLRVSGGIKTFCRHSLSEYTLK